jgi:excisionase family DNA binding protein
MNGKYPTLDLNEAANFLRISPATAQEMAAAGELPGAKIGRAWVFLLDDLIDWLREQVKIQQEARKEQNICPSELPPLPRMDRRSRRRKPPKLPELPSEIGST